MDIQLKVAVIGGGIAGLSSAYYLSKIAHESNSQIQITLIESADYWGGKIKTKVESGFVIEGGPDAYLVTKPWMRTLVHELGLATDLQGTRAENSTTFVKHEGRLVSIPDGLTMAIPSRLAPLLRNKLLTWPQKIRLGLDTVLPPRKQKEDESLASFVSRRLGRAAYERLVGPLLSGIYAGDGERLSLQSTFPILLELEEEHGGLIKGAMALRKQRNRDKAGGRKSHEQKTGSGSVFEAPKSGLVAIVTAIVAHLEKANVDMHLNTRVKEITENENGFVLDMEKSGALQADALVLATPSYVSGQLLTSINPRLAKELGRIEYVSTATVSVAYRKDDLPTRLQGHGYIVPQAEASHALACTWTSSKWNNRAPVNYALLRVFLGRVQDAVLLPDDEETLLEMAKLELRETLGIEVEPIANWVFRWDKAIPQYNLGHPDRMAYIEEELQNFPNLALAGNGYYGIGLPDCVNSGIKAAEKILGSRSKNER